MERVRANADRHYAVVMSEERPKRTSKALTYALLAVAGVLALAIGLLSLAHPFAAWFPGESRRSDLPPVLGVSLLVLPVVLVGLAVYRAGWAIELDAEAWRERRRKRRERAASK